MDKSEFLTPDFLFEEGRVYLFRKRRAYRNFDYSAIESIEFRKGSDLPRPLLAIVTGVALFIYVIVHR